MVLVQNAFYMVILEDVNDNILGLSDYHDSTHHHNSIGLFTMMILDKFLDHLIEILWVTCKIGQQKFAKMQPKIIEVQFEL